MTDTTDARPVTTPLWALDRFLSYAAADDGWSRTGKPELGEAWDVLMAAKDAVLGHQVPAAAQEPQLPAGDYGCVHVMGHTQCEGWVSDGSIAGAACLDVRDEAGRLIAKIPPHSVYMYEPRIPPRVLAAVSKPLAELPAGELDALPPDATTALPATEAYEGYYPEAGDEDAGPADAFAGRTEPASPF